MVKNDDDVITAGSNQQEENVVPVFCVSCVTGDGLDLMTKFLHLLPPGVSNKEKERLEQVDEREFKRNIIDVHFKLSQSL